MSEIIFSKRQATNLSGLLVAMRRSIHSYWTQAAAYQKFVYWIATLFFVSGLFHTAVFLVSGTAWEGPVSWRKPIVFAFSLGITNLSLGWIMTFLPRRQWWGWFLMGLLGIASTVELALITLQQWRGVPSHFNSSTPFDLAVFNWMGAMISLVVVVVLALAVWAFFPLNTSPSMAWAIRLGMVVLVSSQFIGGLLLRNEGTAFGAAGSMKIPHAVSLHALQLLPFLAWLLLFTHWPESRRTRAVIIAAAGYAGLLTLTLLQAFRGLSPFNVSGPFIVVLAASIIAIGGTFATALYGLWQTVRS